MEHNIECPAEMSEKIAEVLVHSMRVAGSFFCKTIPLDADVNIADCWVH